MKLIKPDTTEVVQAIIEATSKPITLHCVAEKVICPACSGRDPFCLVCNGSGYAEQNQTIQASGSVRWKSLEKKIYRPEGQYVEGDCAVVLPYTTEIESILYKVKHVTVDGRKCVVSHWNIRGTPTNRIYLILVEDENMKGTRVS